MEIKKVGKVNKEGWKDKQSSFPFFITSLLGQSTPLSCQAISSPLYTLDTGEEQVQIAGCVCSSLHGGVVCGHLYDH